MPVALTKGGTANMERDRAPKQQPGSPRNLDTSDSHFHNADSRQTQAKNTGPVELGGDGSNGRIRNFGRLMLALKRVHDLALHRYGNRRVPAEASRDIYRVVALIEAAAAASTSGFVPDLHNWSERHLILSERAKAELRAEIQAQEVVVTPALLGEQLGLTYEEREATRFWVAAPIDLDAEELRCRALEKDRSRKEQKRREEGTPLKGSALAEARARYPGVSLSTLKRRAREIRKQQGAA